MKTGLEVWEFGDPAQVAERRELRALNVNRTNTRRLPAKRRRIARLTKQAITKGKR